ncbi:MAG: Secretion system C-terminal sorting domain, partial [Bacteroidota bacterium]
KAAAMQVSPNPASEQTEIRLTVSEAQNATISVVDMAGRVLQTQKWAVVAGENRQSLQVSDLATGLYVVRVAHTGGVSHQQLLKK